MDLLVATGVLQCQPSTDVSFQVHWRLHDNGFIGDADSAFLVDSFMMEAHWSSIRDPSAVRLPRDFGLPLPSIC